MMIRLLWSENIGDYLQPRKIFLPGHLLEVIPLLMIGISLIKVIFTHKRDPSPLRSVEYYVKTDNYNTAVTVARVQLKKDKKLGQRYSRVIMTPITPLRP